MTSRQNEVSPMETNETRKGRTTAGVISHLYLSHACLRSGRMGLLQASISSTAGCKD
jgi:hypothetical protein